jgi:hypothetical protein
MEPRLRPPARDVDIDFGDGALGHALGRVDREADGALGLVDADDRAGPDAARKLVADAQNLEAVLLFAGTTSAMRQLIFVDPMSRAAISPFFGTAGGFAPPLP